MGKVYDKMSCEDVYQKEGMSNEDIEREENKYFLDKICTMLQNIITEIKTWRDLPNIPPKKLTDEEK